MRLTAMQRQSAAAPCLVSSGAPTSGMAMSGLPLSSKRSQLAVSASGTTTWSRTDRRGLEPARNSIASLHRSGETFDAYPPAAPV